MTEDLKPRICFHYEENMACGSYRVNEPPRNILLSLMERDRWEMAYDFADWINEKNSCGGNAGLWLCK